MLKIIIKLKSTFRLFKICWFGLERLDLLDNFDQIRSLDISIDIKTTWKTPIEVIKIEGKII